MASNMKKPVTIAFTKLNHSGFDPVNHYYNNSSNEPSGELLQNTSLHIVDKDQIKTEPIDMDIDEEPLSDYASINCFSMTAKATSSKEHSTKMNSTGPRIDNHDNTVIIKEECLFETSDPMLGIRECKTEPTEMYFHEEHIFTVKHNKTIVHIGLRSVQDKEPPKTIEGLKRNSQSSGVLSNQDVTKTNDINVSTQITTNFHGRNRNVANEKTLNIYKTIEPAIIANGSPFNNHYSSIRTRSKSFSAKNDFCLTKKNIKLPKDKNPEICNNHNNPKVVHQPEGAPKLFLTQNPAECCTSSIRTRSKSFSLNNLTSSLRLEEEDQSIQNVYNTRGRAKLVGKADKSRSKSCTPVTKTHYMEHSNPADERKTEGKKESTLHSTSCMRKRSTTVTEEKEEMVSARTRSKSVRRKSEPLVKQRRLEEEQMGTRIIRARSKSCARPNNTRVTEQKKEVRRTHTYIKSIEKNRDAKLVKSVDQRNLERRQNGTRVMRTRSKSCSDLLIFEDVSIGKHSNGNRKSLETPQPRIHVAERNGDYDVLHEDLNQKPVSCVNNTFLCSVCSYSTKKKKKLSDHERIHRLYNRPVFRCSYCTERYTSRYMVIHVKNAHRELNTEPTNKVGVFLLMNDEKNLKERKQVTETSVISCTMCSYTTTRNKDMVIHKRLHLSKATIYNCSKCDFKSTLVALRFHKKKCFGWAIKIVKDHTTPQYVKSSNEIRCTQCSYTTISTRLFTKHNNSHLSGNPILKCLNCTFKATPMALRYHQKKCVDHLSSTQKQSPKPVEKRKFTCSMCPYSTYLRIKLKFHINKKHMEPIQNVINTEKRFKCNFFHDSKSACRTLRRGQVKNKRKDKISYKKFFR